MIWLSEDYECDELRNKKIVCFGRSAMYISEMLSVHSELSDCIDVIIDNNPKTFGPFQIGERWYVVKGIDYLNEINFEDYTIIITSTYYREIFEQLSQINELQEKTDRIYVFVFSQLKKELAYLKKIENRDLENTILFRSGPKETAYVKGMDYADNARALFEYMRKTDLNKKYKLVWLVKNPEEMKAYIFGENVELIAYDWATSEDVRENEKYYTALFLSKYIFMTDAYGFASNCRKDQIRIQLWHGCGFKTRVNFSPCENRYEYNIVISEKYRQIHRDIYGLRDDQVVITGYPKQDWLRQPYEQSLDKLLNCVKADKYIFWLPTFRMASDQLSELNQYNLATETGLPIIGTENQLNRFNDFLITKNICIIIKLHPFQKKGLVEIGDYSNIKLLYHEELVERDLIINRILAEADALISDYSSAAIDFLSLDRPIAFTLDDVDEYEASRGFVFDPIKDWLPGQEIYSFDDLLRYVDEVFKGEDSAIDKRRSLMNKLVQYCDADNCKRVVEWLKL